VPRRDCSARHGRSRTPACDRPGRDHHAARRVAEEQENLAREGPAEPAARLDWRADDDELRTPFRGNARDVLPEAPRTRADDLASHRDAVGIRHARGRLEPFLELGERAVHVRVQRQLAIDDERGDEDDPGAAVRGQPAGEVERVLRLLPVEQRHDDAAVRDRARPAREAAGAMVEKAYVRELHRRS
jgi:hypothetical protein